MKIVWIIVGAITILVLAFLIGSSKGNADDKEEEKNYEGTLNFLQYKKLTDVNSFAQWGFDTAQAYKMKYPKKTERLTTSATELGKIAKDIYDAKGFWNDDETMTASALRRLVSVSDISPLNAVFMFKYKENIFDYMNSYLNESEMTECGKILAELPAYIVRKPRKEYKQIIKL